MTKLIAALILAAVLFGGWHLFLYWEKVKNEEATARKQAAASVIDPTQLPGLSQPLEPSLQAAQRQGAAGLRQWLKTYDRAVHAREDLPINFLLALRLSNLYSAAYESSRPPIGAHPLATGWKMEGVMGCLRKAAYGLDFQLSQVRTRVGS